MHKDKKLGRKTKGFYAKTLRGFPAKYKGTCILCTEPVRVKEMIGWFDYGKVFHISCYREGLKD